jgi:chaperone BCS1
VRLILKDTRTMGQKISVTMLESTFYNTGNISSSNSASGLSLTTLLETFVPGYGLIHKFLLFAFGFDVTILVFLYIVLWFSNRIFCSVWAVVGNLVYNNYMSEITIDRQDEIYDYMMAFLAHQSTFKSSHRLIVETISKSA